MLIIKVVLRTSYTYTVYCCQYNSVATKLHHIPHNQYQQTSSNFSFTNIDSTQQFLDGIQILYTTFPEKLINLYRPPNFQYQWKFVLFSEKDIIQVFFIFQKDEWMPYYKKNRNIIFTESTIKYVIKKQFLP